MVWVVTEAPVESRGAGDSGGAAALAPEGLMMAALEATAELEVAEDVVDMAEEGAVVQASVSSLRAAHPRWVREISTPWGARAREELPW